VVFFVCFLPLPDVFVLSVEEVVLELSVPLVFVYWVLGGIGLVDNEWIPFYLCEFCV
jgi:hypothetical protein